MVFILKPPVEDSKGIIIFTHKERKMIDSALPYIQGYLTALSERYVIGMHWGWHHENVAPIPFIEFHLAGQGTLSLQQPSLVPHIPFCSRNFLSDCFQPIPGIEKKWDIMMVANRRREKHVKQFFQVLKEILKQRPQTTALIISACPSIKQLNPLRDYVEMEDDFQKIFTEAERQNVTLMALQGEQGTPISSEDLVHYYNASRIFTLFSDIEGESRVISEASLCGIPIVVKAWLKGGGLDYLDSSNSRQFQSLKEAPFVFIDLLEHLASCQPDVELLRRELCEKYTGPKLEAEMKAFFQKKGLIFKSECDLTGLANKLPGHIFLTLPEKWRLPSSNDLNSPVAAMQYIASLSNQSVDLDKIIILNVIWYFQSFKKEVNNFIKRPGHKLRELKLLPVRREYDGLFA